MKIIKTSIEIKPCAQGDHFNAYINFDWDTKSHTVLMCQTCFGTEAEAIAEAKKAIPIMTEFLINQAAEGKLKDDIGIVEINFKNKQSNPTLH